MKKLCLSLSILAFLLFQVHASTPIDSLGMLGDGFDLSGAMDQFKSAKTLEDFESALNNESNYINNLALNNDGDSDYIRVIDNLEDKVHAIIIQAVMGEDEAQDIAVINIEQTSKSEATLQIVGDEDLYGTDYIIEPDEVKGTATGRSGPSPNYHIERIVVYVWFWPSIQYIYTPSYIVYRSPYRWNRYPRRWRPWRPLPLRVHFQRRPHHRIRPRLVHVHRIPRAHKI